MNPDFWHERWQANQIGFHQAQVTPLLERHWEAIAAPPEARVFVPLCGKSLDMVWFASRGHGVLGVELSQQAVDQFFAEHALTPEIWDSCYGRHHVANGIEIILGDVFALDAHALSGCTAVFDRAALIALPPDLRQRYADVHASLPAGCRGLLITLEYPQHEKSGPPFSVPEDEVQALYGRDWRIDRLARDDILEAQQAFREEGVTALSTCACRIEKRS